MASLVTVSNDKLFYVGTWTVEITDCEEGFSIDIYDNCGQRFSKQFDGETDLEGVSAPGFPFTSLETLRKCFELSLQRKNQLSARIDKVKDNLALVIAQESAFAGQLSFSIQLKEVPPTIESRLEQISHFINSQTKDRLSHSHKHEHLRVFHKGLAVVKHTGGNGYVSVSTGKPFNCGRHYFEVKIVRCTGNNCIIGFQSALVPFTPYPGGNPFASGKGICGANGHCYFDGTSKDYGIGGGFVPGDYVGVLLDMNEKKVTFSINEREGEKLSIVDDTYFFVISVYSVGDLVKLLPKYCRHE